MNEHEFQKIDRYLSMHTNVSIKYINNKLKEFPNNNYLLSMKVIGLINLTEIDEAIDVFKKIDSLDSEYKVYELIALINIKTATNDKDLVERLISKAISLEDNNKWLFLIAYRYYWEKVDLNNRLENPINKAIQTIDTAIDIDPLFMPAISEKANLIFNLDNYEPLLEFLEVSYSQNPTNQLHYWLGKAYYLNDKIEQAYYYLELATQSSHKTDCYTMLYSIENDIKKQEILLTKAYNINSNDFRIEYLLGEFYLKNFKYSDALMHLESLTTNYHLKEFEKFNLLKSDYVFRCSLIQMHEGDFKGAKGTLAQNCSCINESIDDERNYLKVFLRDYKSYNSNELEEQEQILKSIFTGMDLSIIESFFKNQLLNS